MNAQGDFIWYELMTSDMDAARAFYEPVVGWTMGAAATMPGMDYRMISVGENMVGGMMAIDADMAGHGAKPLWIGYVAVTDVDATAQAITAAGGHILLPPSDIPGIGRFAMASDPDGAPFYIMRGASDETSRVFAEETVWHWGWNELWTPDPDRAIVFYGAIFGWHVQGAMPMGPAGEYRFLFQGETRIGAIGPVAALDAPDRPACWRHYFNIPSVAAAVAAIAAHGGAVTNGPHVVPGGATIIVARDPQGAEFALVGGA